MTSEQIDRIAELIFDRTEQYNGWYYDEVTRRDIAKALSITIIDYLEDEWNKKK